MPDIIDLTRQVKAQAEDTIDAMRREADAVVADAFQRVVKARNAEHWRELNAEYEDVRRRADDIHSGLQRARHRLNVVTGEIERRFGNGRR